MLGTLNQEQIDDVLRREVVGRIGCHAEGRVYVVPISYVYDNGVIYAHTTVGLKVELMRKNPRVCFEVDNMDNLANWQSVIAWGRYEELADASAMVAMTKLVNRLAPLVSSETSMPSHGTHPHEGPPANAVVFRIVLDEKTGRYERR